MDTDRHRHSKTLHTSHSTLYTPRSRLYYGAPIEFTLDTTFYTWHCALLTPCWVTDCLSLHTVHSTCFKRYCPPFSHCFQRCSVVFFLPFSCHSSIFLNFPPVFNDFPSFSVVFFLPCSWHSSIFPLFSTIFLRFFLPFSCHSSIFQRFSFIFLGFFLPFSCRSQRT